MQDIVYVSNITEHIEGKLRHSYVPEKKELVKFSVHGAIAEHYGVTSDIADPHAVTLDYVVAAAGG